jgi:hypothetical protein
MADINETLTPFSQWGSNGAQLFSTLAAARAAAEQLDREVADAKKEAAAEQEKAAAEISKEQTYADKIANVERAIEARRAPPPAAGS